MLKALTFLKRRPGMSMAEFIDYYETRHAPLGISLMPKARRYFRRYVTPQVNPITGEPVEIDFDVVMELWFDDRAALDETLAALSKPEIAAIVAADEDKIFDRGKNRFTIVEERETAIPGGVQE